MGTAGTSLKIFSYLLAPYVIGILLSAYVFPNDVVQASAATSAEQNRYATATATATSTTRSNNLEPVMIPALEVDPFNGLKIRVHRNGETEVCGETVTAGDDLEISKAIRSSAAFVPTFSPQAKPSTNKYSVDAILTHALSSQLLMEKDSCGIAPNPEPNLKRTAVVWDKWYDEASTRPWDSEFLKFCDMGEDRTTIQTDHDNLVKIPAAGKSSNAMSYPCHFHTREGVRVTSFEQLADLARLKKNSCENGDDELLCSADPILDLYAVQAGRVFMFATSHVGEMFELPHVTNSQGGKIVLETLSLSPRVFDIHEFFTGDESDAIVNKALSETAETHKLKRSTTGASGRNVIATRTSENAFDTHSKDAQLVKRRCLKALGFDQYEEGVTDGLQVLRYSRTNGYIPHMDYIDDIRKKESHDYDSMLLGSNRFATILLYFTDMQEGAGGETVFVQGWPNNTDERVQLPEAIAEAKELGLTTLFNKGSWEEKMVAQCRSRLAVTPSRAKAVLFYSQHADGQADPTSQHGGCPVLEGTKWAANLWVWNAPRGGFKGSPLNEWAKKEGVTSTDDTDGVYAQLQATFMNSGSDSGYDKAEVFFQDTFWAKLGKGSPPVKVNTYAGHEWNVKVNDKIVKQWKIASGQKHQQFHL